MVVRPILRLGEAVLSGTSYPPDFVTKLEMQWGVGFLSPGGPQEVQEILRNIRVEGMTVLDLGCGIGGPDIVIARNLSPAQIVGIDVEPYLVERGQENIRNAGLGSVVELKLVYPGPLPFEDQAFDIVFSKDSLIHIEDKSALYEEVYRVLRIGGRFAASDWLRSADADELTGFNEWRSLTTHSFSMRTAAETIVAMRHAGFDDVKTRDRTKWYAEIAMQEIQMMESDEWRDQFISAFGEENYANGLVLRKANAGAAACGGLAPTHIFGSRS